MSTSPGDENGETSLWARMPRSVEAGIVDEGP